LRSNTKGYDGKTHYTDSQNSDTTAPSGRELYHLQFSLQAASPGTSHRWKDNIRMDLRKTGWEDVDWMHLGQHNDQWWALVNAVMKLWVP
jgi:hypothetical protein